MQVLSKPFDLTLWPHSNLLRAWNLVVVVVYVFYRQHSCWMPGKETFILIYREADVLSIFISNSWNPVAHTVPRYMYFTFYM